VLAERKQLDRIVGTHATTAQVHPGAARL